MGGGSSHRCTTIRSSRLFQTVGIHDRSVDRSIRGFSGRVTHSLLYCLLLPSLSRRIKSHPRKKANTAKTQKTRGTATLSFRLRDLFARRHSEKPGGGEDGIRFFARRGRRRRAGGIVPDPSVREPGEERRTVRMNEESSSPSMIVDASNGTGRKVENRVECSRVSQLVSQSVVRHGKGYLFFFQIATTFSKNVSSF